MNLGVVILAAGFSTRMGRPKMLLRWRGTSVLGHLLGQWRDAGAAQVAVVCAANCEATRGVASEGVSAVPEELDRLGFPAGQRILNPHPQDGMFSSIRCAAVWPGWRPKLTHWAIALGDQPHLRAATLGALVEFAARHSDRVCQPTHGGRPRHPVVLPARVFARLNDSGAEHLKHFLHVAGEEARLCRVDDPGLDFDLDEPADYEKALRQFGGEE